MRLAIVGATGLVGKTILNVIKEQNIKFSDLILVASERSAGNIVVYQGKEYVVKTLPQALKEQPDIAIFSAGGSTSKQWAKQFAEQGCFVVDNSSAWRMEPGVPLIVPEINGDILKDEHKIIANPNCSTIQVVMALAPLHNEFNLRKLIISTYQSVSGSGKKGIDQLIGERAGTTPEKAYPHPIDLNCIPQGGNFLENGYTEEEMKLVNETRKILSEPNISITSTVVRVPVMGGHSASIYAEFKKAPNLEKTLELLHGFPGITVMDDPDKAVYPMPLYVKDQDDVFVGRIRKSLMSPNALDMWVVADNLRKGAATNAVQIVQTITSLLKQ